MKTFVLRVALLVVLALQGSCVRTCGADSSAATCGEEKPLVTTALTENAANADFTTGLPVPQAGIDDFPTAAAFLATASLQELADRSQALAKFLGVASNQIVRAIPLLPMPALGDASFTPSTSGSVPTKAVVYVQSDTSGAGYLGFSLDPLPVGAKIVSLTAFVQGSVGAAHAGLPGTLPSLSLIRQQAAGVVQVGSTQGDTSASQAAYDASHQIVLTLGQTVVSAYSYSVIFTGETGANAANNKLGLRGLYATLAFF